MTIRYRSALCGTVASMLAISGNAALAQAPAPETACFQMMATPAGAGPASTILLDRCTGQTWILARRFQAAAKGRSGNAAFRWEPLSKDNAEPPPSRKPVATAPTATGDKCFTFQGRRFCE